MERASRWRLALTGGNDGARVTAFFHNNWKLMAKGLVSVIKLKQHFSTNIDASIEGTLSDILGFSPYSQGQGSVLR